MDEAPRAGDRIVGKTEAPDDERVGDWLGPEAFGFWTRLSTWIGETYPGVFVPDWIYGGRKHGWCLRFKKPKAFCTFVPEYHSFSVVVVLGAAEREKVEAHRATLGDRLMTLYDGAQTFHDGKWLKIAVSSEAMLEEVEALLLLKRAPRPLRGA